MELKKNECFLNEFNWIGSSNEVELFTKKKRIEQNRLIDPALKQPRRFEVLVPFITVFPYSENSYDNMLSALILKYYFPIIPCHFPVSRHENFRINFCLHFCTFLKSSLKRKSDYFPLFSVEFPVIRHLRICSSLACVYRVMDARGKFGEHEKCVRVARGAAESNCSFLSALQTSQVHP